MRVQCLKPQAIIIPVRIDKATELPQATAGNPHAGQSKQSHRSGNARAEARRQALQMQTVLNFDAF